MVAEWKDTSRLAACRSHEVAHCSPLVPDSLALRLLAAVRPAAGIPFPGPLQQIIPN